jgi:hypothetical protein
MSKPKKFKKYMASSVFLPVKDELRAANGNRQFCICLTATSKKHVLEILNATAGGNFSLYSLNNFNGLWVNETFPFTPPSNGEVYFMNEHINTPHFREWLRLQDWKRT